MRRRALADDSGLTLAELCVAVAAGGVVLAAAAALLLPATQSTERARRASLALTVAEQVSEEVGRQVRDASRVTVAPGGTALTLCTYPSAGSSGRADVVWTFDPATHVLSSGRTGAPASYSYGDAETFADVAFSGPAGHATLLDAEALTVTLRTVSRAGVLTGVPATDITTAVVPRAGQLVQGSPCA